MIVASSTPPDNQTELTIEMLDAAPVGSWVSFRWHPVASSIYRRSGDGWVRRGDLYQVPVPVGILVEVWGDHPDWVLHHPGLALVTSHPSRMPHKLWGWSCSCGDGLDCLPSAATAGDDARAHVIQHAVTAGDR